MQVAEVGVTEMEFSRGSVIGNFKLVEQLSSGAFTERWLAEKAALEAEKVVLEIVTDSALSSTLKSEGVKLPQKHHSAHLLCGGYNIRTEPFYFIYEKFDSRTLLDLLKEKRRLDLKSSILIFAQLLDALGAAHSGGILHLNLTPENVFVDAGGRVKVGGFGLGASLLSMKQYLAARTVVARGEFSSMLAPLSSRSRTSIVTRKEIDSLYQFIADTEGAKIRPLLQNLGKVSAPSGADITADYDYIAPEQKENKPPDVRTDIYSLGVMLFQMITGSRPLRTQKITDLRPDAPPTLDRIFIKATATQPQRYTSVAEIAKEFEPIRAKFISPVAYEEVREKVIPAKPKTTPVKRSAPETAAVGVGIDVTPRETEKRFIIEHKERAILRTQAKAKMPKILLFAGAAAVAAIILSLIFVLPKGAQKTLIEVTRVTDEKEEEVKTLLAEIDKQTGTGNYDFGAIVQRLRELRTQADGTTLIPQIDARIERLTQKFETDSRNEYDKLIRRFNNLLASERFQDAIACLSAYPERFRKSAYWTEKIPEVREKAVYLERAKDEFASTSAAFEREVSSLKIGEERAALDRIRAIVDSFVRSYGDTPFSAQLTNKFNALIASPSFQGLPVATGPAQEEAKRTPRVAVKFENWTHPTIPSNSVTALASDGRGGILCATLSGVSRYDGKEWKQVILKDETNKPRLEKENVTCILAIGNTTWFGTPGGLYRESQGKVTLFQTSDGLPANWIVSVACAPDSSQLWAGTTEGASIFDGSLWRNFTVKDGLANNHVNSILITPRDVLLATRGGLTIVSRPERATQEVISSRTFTIASGLPSDSVTALCPDSAGLWIGTEDGLCYTPGTLSAVSAPVKLTTYTTENGLPGNFITCLAVDSGNNVFAGTRSGLAHFDGQKWTTYTKETGLTGNMITALAVVGNHLYVGTHFGLSRIVFAGR
jgi:serine/threonine protein kinase